VPWISPPSGGAEGSPSEQAHDAAAAIRIGMAERSGARTRTEAHSIRRASLERRACVACPMGRGCHAPMGR
jgi:hypothetical protein